MLSLTVDEMLRLDLSTLLGLTGRLAMSALIAGPTSHPASGDLGVAAVDGR
jgi:hypothetical protein